MAQPLARTVAALVGPSSSFGQNKRRLPVEKPEGHAPCRQLIIYGMYSL